jgi:hypothetical protein
MLFQFYQPDQIHIGLDISEGQETGAIAPAPENIRKKI